MGGLFLWLSWPGWGFAQGFVVEAYKPGPGSPAAAGAAERARRGSCGFSFGTEEGITLPLYMYLPANKVIEQYKSPVCVPISSIEKERENTDAGDTLSGWVHYLAAPPWVWELSPGRGELAKMKESGEVAVRGKVGKWAFGICYNAVRNEVYVSYVDRPWIRVYEGEGLVLRDSLRLLGNSGRYMAVSGPGDRLYVGVRSCRAIVMFDLNKQRMTGFVRTGNLPGPMYWSENQVLYSLNDRYRVVSKFDANTLAHLESQRLDLDGPITSFVAGGQGLQISGIEGGVRISDTLAKRADYYTETSLDSTGGAYTWIASSHTKPKWALARMKEFEKLGLSCSLGRTSDGYYRVCVGLYPNQEKAVEEKNAHADALMGAWLMSINPKKF